MMTFDGRRDDFPFVVDEMHSSGKIAGGRELRIRRGRRGALGIRGATGCARGALEVFNLEARLAPPSASDCARQFPPPVGHLWAAGAVWNHCTDHLISGADKKEIFFCFSFVRLL